MVFLYCQNTLEITHAQRNRKAMNPMPTSRLVVSFSGAASAWVAGVVRSISLWLMPVPGRPTLVLL